MHIIGKINYEIYKCITDQIITDEVIITENQIEKRISLARFSACGGACKRHLPYRRSAILAERFMSQEISISYDIKNHHPNDYERFSSYFQVIVEAPDYIIEANKPNTALILKEVELNGEKFKTVLRLITPKDNPEYKNSIITFMKIDQKEWDRLLRNKKVLYKKE